MTKNSARDSILVGNYCDVVKFFRARDIDDTDRLTQRALNIIFRTQNLVQTGNEVDTDPFTANMFATIALAAINQTLTTYPFLKPAEFEPEADEEAVFAGALENIETAERLSPEPDILSFISTYEEMFGKYRAPEGGFLIVAFDGADFPASAMNFLGHPQGYAGAKFEPHELAHELGGERYRFVMSDLDMLAEEAFDAHQRRMYDSSQR